MRVAFKGNIIVWNLPEDFTDAELAALFDDHGLVLGAKISRRQAAADGRPRGLVDLAPAKAVDAAVESLDGRIVGEQKLRVRRVREAPAAAKQTRAAVRSPGTSGDAGNASAGTTKSTRPGPGTAPRPFVVERKIRAGRRFGSTE